MSPTRRPRRSRIGANRSTSASDIDGGATFDLGGTEGRAVLLWITQLGSSPNRMQVDELVVRS